MATTEEKLIEIAENENKVYAAGEEEGKKYVENRMNEMFDLLHRYAQTYITQDEAERKTIKEEISKFEY